MLPVNFMVIYINNIAVRLFRGAKVEDALQKFSGKQLREIVAGRKKVLDCTGRPATLGCRLCEGDQFSIL